ncbi:hypothetical protein ACLOJK_019612, partial [Asimina triloba]
ASIWCSITLIRDRPASFQRTADRAICSDQKTDDAATIADLPDPHDADRICTVKSVDHRLPRRQ